MESRIKLGIAFIIIIAVIITSNPDINKSFMNFLNINSKNPKSDSTLIIKSKTVRIGYFPNVNHAQAIIGLMNGDYKKTIEGEKNQNQIKIDSFMFTAGPSVIEALYGGQIDVAYVGPNPAISGYIASDGEGLRIISGAASGGSVFIVRNDAGINTIKDLGGKKFASPQLGNTQDVSLRKYLINNGFNTVENGGNVTVVTIKPSDILTLMIKKELDGAWVPEPLGVQLVNEANGKVFVDERELWPPDGKFVTANIIVRTDYLKNNPETIKKLLEAHVDETLWINQRLKTENNITTTTTNDQKIQEVIQAFNNGLKQITGKTIPEYELYGAFKKLDFTYDPLSSSLYKMAKDAESLGFISKGKVNKLDLSKIYDLTLLNQVLIDKGLKPIDK